MERDVDIKIRMLCFTLKADLISHPILYQVICFHIISLHVVIMYINYERKCEYILHIMDEYLCTLQYILVSWFGKRLFCLPVKVKDATTVSRQQSIIINGFSAVITKTAYEFLSSASIE